MTNIGSDSATITWVSKNKEYGHARKKLLGGDIFLDDKEKLEDSKKEKNYTHQVTIYNLEPEKENIIWFGKDFFSLRRIKIKTFPEKLIPPTIENAYGYVVLRGESEQDLIPYKDSIVYIKFKKNDRLFSSTVSDNGSWLISLPLDDLINENNEEFEIWATAGNVGKSLKFISNIDSLKPFNTLIIEKTDEETYVNISLNENDIFSELIFNVNASYGDVCKEESTGLPGILCGEGKCADGFLYGEGCWIGGSCKKRDEEACRDKGGLTNNCACVDAKCGDVKCVEGIEQRCAPIGWQKTVTKCDVEGYNTDEIIFEEAKTNLENGTTNYEKWSENGKVACYEYYPEEKNGNAYLCKKYGFVLDNGVCSWGQNSKGVSSCVSSGIWNGECHLSTSCNKGICASKCISGSICIGGNANSDCCTGNCTLPKQEKNLEINLHEINQTEQDTQQNNSEIITEVAPSVNLSYNYDSIISNGSYIKITKDDWGKNYEGSIEQDGFGLYVETYMRKSAGANYGSVVNYEDGTQMTTNLINTRAFIENFGKIRNLPLKPGQKILTTTFAGFTRAEMFEANYDGGGKGACLGGNAIAEIFGIFACKDSGDCIPVFEAPYGVFQAHSKTLAFYGPNGQAGYGQAINTSPAGQLPFAINPALCDYDAGKCSQIVAQINTQFIDTNPSNARDGDAIFGVGLSLVGLEDLGYTKYKFYRVTENRDFVFKSITGGGDRYIYWQDGTLPSERAGYSGAYDFSVENIVYDPHCDFVAVAPSGGDTIRDFGPNCDVLAEGVYIYSAPVKAEIVTGRENSMISPFRTLTYAEDDLIMLVNEGRYVFEQNGVYQIEYDGVKYQVYIPKDNLYTTIFIDKNENGTFEEKIDFVLNENPINLKNSKIAKAYTYFLEPGYNLISFPFILEENKQKASELLEHINKENNDAIYSIAQYKNRWEAVAQNKQLYNPNDFNILVGNGYLVSAKRRVKFTLYGKEVDIMSDNSIAKINFAKGWNLTAIYGNNSKEYTALNFLKDLKSDNINVQNISRWNPNTQRYEIVHIDKSNVYGTDFDVLNYEGYFIKNIGEKATWTIREK